MLLRVELEADPVDQVKLGFEEIDVVLFILHQILEQIARHIVLDAMTISRRFLIQVARTVFGREIALDDLLDVLADAQGIEHLHVGKAVKEAYFHCGKALMRSKLWSPDLRVKREVFPSISQVIHDQTTLGEPESQAEVEARYKTQL